MLTKQAEKNIVLPTVTTPLDSGSALVIDVPQTYKRGTDVPKVRSMKSKEGVVSMRSIHLVV